MRLSFFAFTCVLMLVSCVALAYAEYVPPDKVKIQTAAYTPEESDFELGEYSYNVTWQGIPVGTAAIKVGDTMRGGAPVYHVEATAKTTRGIDLFYKLRHKSEGVFESDTFRPIAFVSHQKENSREKWAEIRFEEDGKVHSKRWKKGRNPTKLDFQSENHMFDPISAAFLARSLPLETDKELAFDVFNGKHRYLISFQVHGTEVIKSNGQERLSYKVQPFVKKLTDTEGEKKFRSAYLWISADDKREVLRLESRVWIGKVSAELAKTKTIKQVPRQPKLLLARVS